MNKFIEKIVVVLVISAVVTSLPGIVWADELEQIVTIDEESIELKDECVEELLEEEVFEMTDILEDSQIYNTDDISDGEEENEKKSDIDISYEDETEVLSWVEEVDIETDEIVENSNSIIVEKTDESAVSELEEKNISDVKTDKEEGTIRILDREDIMVADGDGISSKVYNAGGVTQDDILNLLKKYSPDGYYILSEAVNNGSDITMWWDKPDIVAGIDTAVHEETHRISSAFQGERLYLSEQKSIVVPYGMYFSTSDMAQNIPENLRTFNYDFYVSTNSFLSSNSQGVYGLLNEFDAYYQGFNAMYQLKDYIATYADTGDEWAPYFAEIEFVNSYYEFKYWILSYLLYAKTNNKEVYEDTLNNSEFCQAYAFIESHFSDVISKYEKSLTQINGVRISNGCIWYDGKSYWMFEEDRNKLKPELARPEYVAMNNILTAGTWQQDSNGWKYIHADGTYVKKGWEKIAGDWYRFDENGYRITGWIYTGGNHYWANDKGIVQLNRWINVNGKYYRSDVNGVILKSQWIKVNNYYYRADASGAIRMDQWIKVGEKYYRSNSKGIIRMNQWIKVGDKYYRADDKGVIRMNQWIKVGDKYYRADDKGVIRMNQWIKVGGKYYRSDSKGVIRMNQWIKVGDKYYRADANGVIIMNQWINVDGKYYWPDSKGIIQMNKWVTIDGKQYYFDSKGIMTKSI